MPICKTHQQWKPCPDCKRNRRNAPYRGMETPLVKQADIHRGRVNGKPWANPLNAPEKSEHISQK